MQLCICPVGGALWHFFPSAVKSFFLPTWRYLMSLRGHVGSVYQVAWSADSRLLVSGSSDSTLKVWDMKTGKLNMDLPGHADEVTNGKMSWRSEFWCEFFFSDRFSCLQVYAVDWSPDGQRVASGGKDKCLRMYVKLQWTLCLYFAKC